MDIQGRIVVITGASMGIGAATAQVFAAAGAKLVLAARSADKLAALADALPPGAEALVIPTDVTDPEQVRALLDAAVARFGRVDMVINNAGQAAAGPVATVDPNHYRRIIELNLFGPLHMIQAAVPIMRAQGGGVIINISSNVSKMAIPGIGAYASTKYALNGLSLTARNELAADNIRVVLFHPGLTATDFGKNALVSNPGDGPRPTREMPARAPDSAEDVARAILEAAIAEPAEAGMPMAG